MADVTLTYKGNTILELSASGNKTIQTAGKYCEGDIGLAYVKSGGGSIPSFMNHFESGSFEVTSGSEYNIQLTDISEPKGVLVFSNGFNLYSAKEDKPLLGAFMAVFIAGTDTEDQPISSGVRNVGYNTQYAYNFGSDTNNAKSSAGNTRTTNRGVKALKITDKRVLLGGFGTGEYDFKYNVTYNWIAWD